MMDDLNSGGASPSDRATRASTEPASSLGHSAGIPDASDDIIAKAIAERDIKRLAKMMEPIAGLISLYSQTVRDAQKRYEKDCAMLAEMIALSSKIAHAIASVGADALEQQYAQGIEAGTDETPQEASGETPASGDPANGGLSDAK